MDFFNVTNDRLTINCSKWGRIRTISHPTQVKVELGCDNEQLNNYRLPLPGNLCTKDLMRSLSLLPGQAIKNQPIHYSI